MALADDPGSGGAEAYSLFNLPTRVMGIEADAEGRTK